MKFSIILIVITFLVFFVIMPLIEYGRVEGSNILLDPEVVCKKALRTKSKLSEICRNNPGLLNEIKKGIKLGFQECAFQFNDRQWNCTLLRRNMMRKVLNKDSRETSFLTAMTAAGIAYSVTKACSSGSLVECSCDRNRKKRNVMFDNNGRRNSIEDIEDKYRNLKRTRRRKSYIRERRNQQLQIRREKQLLKTLKMPTGDWEWGGCGDNIYFGFRKSRDFLDSRYRKKSDIKTLVKLHNNNAGRLAIKNNMRMDCKCHGLSGSCTIKTCWLRMPPFHEIGAILRERFNGASKVISGNDGNSFMSVPSTKMPTKIDLIYTEESPNFCIFNHTTGSLGTYGRKCNPDSQGIDGCELLCCNRGYNVITIKERVNCDCVFKWCCEVKCKTCIEERQISTCK